MASWWTTKGKAIWAPCGRGIEIWCTFNSGLYHRGRESPGRGHKQCFLESLLVFNKINLFFGVQFAVSLVSLKDFRSHTKFRSDKKIRTMYKHSRFIFVASRNSDRIKASVPNTSTRGLFSPRRSLSIEIGLSFSNFLWIKPVSYSFIQGKLSTPLSFSKPYLCSTVQKKKTEWNVEFLATLRRFRAQVAAMLKWKWLLW